ncbi:hypothetical protein S7711_11532 [Stachybotrys chartarum IBT 7711]|uniref:Uncharacterized protein n=1 Tax=Stachybotrys chartarum (strain CBS 109288 / IBT 7711) TaxID=1280523 RepID=A0A084B6S5_STACB|nr:hypothetical protein S7711_11532 [Stachybotrys chartarum IBT 7711]
MSSSGDTKAEALTVMNNLLPDTDTGRGQKPAFAVDAGPARPLRRYWVRTLSVILIPSIITAWYGVIWVGLVLGIENDDAAKYRHFSGSLIFYSWFIIGIFGLSWSEYGLAGVEFAMLQSRFWKVSNLSTLMMHSDATWSSPSGWFKAIRHRQVSRLWSLLTLLTILPYVAFPLSGLVFEITDGYTSTSAHPWVMGRNASTFLGSFGSDYAVQNAWQIGLSPTIPGFGIVYTLPGVDRAEHPSLEQVPNTLPLTPSFSDMFLAPQADKPVSGRAWGLWAQYNCSIVRAASELTILGEKPVSMFSSTERDLETGRTTVQLRTPSGYEIHASNSSTHPQSVNLWSYSEMGMSVPSTYTRTYNSTGQIGVTVNISQSTVLEYVLWQIRFRGYYDGDTIPPFNSTLGPVIEGMGSPFYRSGNGTLLSNDSFFEIRQGDIFSLEDPFQPPRLDANVTDLRDYFDPTQLTEYEVGGGNVNNAEPVLDVAAPIGVRCVASSDVGEATLDGVMSTFTDFKHVDPISVTGGVQVVFGTAAWATLGRTRFSDFYRASHSPRELHHGSLWTWQGYVNSEALLRTSMLAYGLNAIDIMYQFASGFEGAWVDRTLTASRDGRILSIASLIPGHGLGYFVLVLFCLWSGVSAMLGIIYGFQNRTAAKLDGYTMFKHGADMSEYLQ